MLTAAYDAATSARAADPAQAARSRAQPPNSVADLRWIPRTGQRAASAAP